MTVRNMAGEPVETNATDRDHDTIEVVLSGVGIATFEKWLDGKGLLLGRIPSGPDSLPAYCITFRLPLSGGTVNASGSEPDGTETP